MDISAHAVFLADRPQVGQRRHSGERNQLAQRAVHAPSPLRTPTTLIVSRARVVVNRAWGALIRSGLERSLSASSNRGAFLPRRWSSSCVTKMVHELPRFLPIQEVPASRHDWRCTCYCQCGLSRNRPSASRSAHSDRKIALICAAKARTRFIHPMWAVKRASIGRSCIPFAVPI
jgi:hypothetical protein